MQDPMESVPAGVDPRIPNGARIYDFMLGGKDNYAADRQAAEHMLQANPMAPRTAQANRAFLGRAVRYLAGEAGIDQFLDIGTGLPTQQNVHEVAQDAEPGSRTVYVDYDPVVTVHARALLSRTNSVAVVEHDLRDPAAILADPITQEMLDFARPVAVLLVAVLHFVQPQEDPAGIVATLRDALAPGSHLVISHTASESPGEIMEAAQRGFRASGAPLVPRTRAEIERFFDGTGLLDPGLVDVRDWRPVGPQREGPAKALPWTIVGGVGRLG